MDHNTPSMTVVALVSLALHAALAWSLGGNAHAVAPVRPQPVRVTVREVAWPLPPATPELDAMTPVASEPTPSVPTPSVPTPSSRRTERKPKVAPAQQPAVAEPAPALDFTGVTLTSPNGGFATIAGNGQTMTGPLSVAHAGSRHGSNAAPSSAADGKGAAQGAELVALGSLSRPPRAPALDDALAANYPKNAHDLGLSGEAVVRARILPSGEVAATHVLVASAPEFGKACQRTLAGSRWSAPLDAGGHPVATELSYKCVFAVTH